MDNKDLGYSAFKIEIDGMKAEWFEGAVSKCALSGRDFMRAFTSLSALKRYLETPSAVNGYLGNPLGMAFEAVIAGRVLQRIAYHSSASLEMALMGLGNEALVDTPFNACEIALLIKALTFFPEGDGTREDLLMLMQELPDESTRLKELTDAQSLKGELAKSVEPMWLRVYIVDMFF